MERRAERGESAPALEEQPRLWPHLERFLQCFRDCSKRRAEGTRAIPLVELVAWLDLHQITDTHDREEFFFHVNAMDDVYVAHFAKKES